MAGTQQSWDLTQSSGSWSSVLQGAPGRSRLADRNLRDRLLGLWKAWCGKCGSPVLRDLEGRSMAEQDREGPQQPSSPDMLDSGASVSLFVNGDNTADCLFLGFWGAGREHPLTPGGESITQSADGPWPPALRLPGASQLTPPPHPPRLLTGRVHQRGLGWPELAQPGLSLERGHH